MALNQDDFRKILATPRAAPGTTPSLAGSSRGSSKLDRFKKPPAPARIRREGRSDVLEHSHVDLGSGFTDRAKERRLSELRGDLKGDEARVKGLDYDLLRKVRSGEFVIPKVELPDPRLNSDDDDSDKEEEREHDDAVLDELLQME